ncbi:hypothetical protein OnM2_057056 [Erysiphe neolycopersici]|uniref:Uncharacterized protein n=1 Tax=Erysiphe neolycopersici TaxID=212602 RepID=A0A420HQT4_9PEZI|nr:hypothetical protein OnM2_057056 [Erysiphe neolycopersici]
MEEEESSLPFTRSDENEHNELEPSSLLSFSDRNTHEEKESSSLSNFAWMMDRYFKSTI